MFHLHKTNLRKISPRILNKQNVKKKNKQIGSSYEISSCCFVQFQIQVWPRSKVPNFRVPDEWVNEKDYTAKKNVPIPKLDASAKNVLKPLLFPQEDATRTRQKHRRKPATSTNNGSGRTT